MTAKDASRSTAPEFGNRAALGKKPMQFASLSRVATVEYPAQSNCSVTPKNTTERSLFRDAPVLAALEEWSGIQEEATPEIQNSKPPAA